MFLRGHDCTIFQSISTPARPPARPPPPRRGRKRRTRGVLLPPLASSAREIHRIAGREFRRRSARDARFRPTIIAYGIIAIPCSVPAPSGNCLCIFSQFAARDARLDPSTRYIQASPSPQVRLSSAKLPPPPPPPPPPPASGPARLALIRRSTGPWTAGP